MRKYICIVCGYEHVGDVPPERCPICKAPSNRFSEMLKGKEKYGDFIVSAANNNENTTIKQQNKTNSYYYLDQRNCQAGPLHPSEFQKHGINESTLVWRHGMTNWTPAGQIAELIPYLGQVVQSGSQQAPINTQQRPDNFMVWAILSTIFCCLPTGIAAIFNANAVDTLWYEGKPQESIETMKCARKWTFISIGIGLVSYLAAGLLGLPGACFIQLLALSALFVNGLSQGISPSPLRGVIIIIIWAVYIFAIVPALFNWCMGL